MDDIAERAGVSKPVLYQHFPGKLDLYLALLDQHCESLLQAVQAALASTTDNKLRVRATMDAYFAYVEDDGGAFRLVFESDLTNEPAVRERVDKVTFECAEAICEVIAEDTGLSKAESMLLASGLGGLAQVVARSWLHSDRSVPRDQAVQLLTSLAWRGIAGFRCTAASTTDRGAQSTTDPGVPPLITGITPGITTDRHFVPTGCSLLAFSGGACTSPHRANVCCVRRGRTRTSVTVGGT